MHLDRKSLRDEELMLANKGVSEVRRLLRHSMLKLKALLSKVRRPSRGRSSNRSVSEV